MRTSYYLHMRINYNYGSYSRKCHKDFGLPQNDIGVGSSRVGRAFALHELAKGYYLLLAMIGFVQNGHTNHANLKAPPNPHSKYTASGMASPGPYNSKYLDPSEPIFQSYTEIYG